MTTGKADERRARLWTPQNLNVQRPGDPFIIRSPAYEREKPCLLALCSPLMKEAQTGVCTQVCTGVAAGVQCASGVKPASGGRIQKWEVRND